MWCFLVTCQAFAPAAGRAAADPVAWQESVGDVRRVRVVDATTGEGLADAIVQCGQSTPALTDASGTTSVSSCATGLVITRDGYVEARLPMPAQGDVEVRLIPERRAAESVTVVGPAAGQAEAAVPAQIAITRDELAMLRGVTFDDPLRTLQQLPGVATSDELRAELSVRGSPFRQVGLVLDEVKSRLLVHTVRGVDNTGSVALLNADLLDAASLTPGAGPQRFGNTVGAELAIRTRAGRPAWHGRGMASAIAATGFVEGPIGTDRVTFIAGARKSYASWIVRRIDPDVSGTFEFTDAQAKLDARLSTRQSLSAGVLAGTSTYDERGRRSGANALDVGKNQTTMGTLAWQAQLGSHWVVRQRVAGISSTYRNANPDALPLDSGTEHEWLSRSIVEWAPQASISLDGAAQVQRFTSRGSSVVYHPTTRLPQSDTAHAGEQTLAGGHVHARWSPHRAMTLAGGARVDHVPDLETFVGGWAQAQVALSPSLAVTAAVSRQGQSPDVLQRFGPAGTADLRFERATLVDGGIGWRRGPYTIAVNLYQRRETDGLDTPGRQFRLTSSGQLAGGDPRAPWVNALSGRARGAEVLLRRQPSTTPRGVRWSGWIGYSYGRTTYEGELDPSFPGAFEQRHLVTISATTQVGSRWDASTTLRLATNWPYEGWYEERSDGRIYLSSERNGLRLPEYGRLDVRVRYRVPLPHGRLLLFAEALNATNATNYRQVSASVNLRTYQVGRLSEKQLPIIPAVGAAFEF
ncbi:hypothetical protein TBR22_A43690 [Luteitalea sp. TBR-22]|nr:hypothetical protein TBR22_A43690 [Luteitalea sp. TBR-22]